MELLRFARMYESAFILDRSPFSFLSGNDKIQEKMSRKGSSIKGKNSLQRVKNSDGALSRRLSFISFSLALAILSLGMSTIGFIRNEQLQNSTKFNASQKQKMKEIAQIIWEKKPENKILETWGLFVDKEKGNTPDFKAAIQWIFLEVKATAEQNGELAKNRIQQAQLLKKEIDQELAHIRQVRLQLGKKGNPFPVKRKRFEFNKDNLTGFTVREDGRIFTEEALRAYEGFIEWGGKEASLAGTGGVALLEYAKDTIQTAVSNISGVGTLAVQMKKTAERKIGSMG